MGPRSRDRGNATVKARKLVYKSLQWGRDHVIAETAGGSAGCGRKSMLQWGRDHVIAETQRGAAGHWSIPRLQWGRDHVIAETGERRELLDEFFGFNGAAIT